MIIFGRKNPEKIYTDLVLTAFESRAMDVKSGGNWDEDFHMTLGTITIYVNTKYDGTIKGMKIVDTNNGFGYKTYDTSFYWKRARKLRKKLQFQAKLYNDLKALKELTSCINSTIGD